MDINTRKYFIVDDQRLAQILSFLRKNDLFHALSALSSNGFMEYTYMLTLLLYVCIKHFSSKKKTKLIIFIKIV